jgi:hypothetical protein
MAVDSTGMVGALKVISFPAAIPAGGIPVAVPKDPLADVKVNIKREGGAASRTGPRSEMGANYEGSDDDDDEEEMEEDEEVGEPGLQQMLTEQMLVEWEAVVLSSGMATRSTCLPVYQGVTHGPWLSAAPLSPRHCSD